MGSRQQTLPFVDDRTIDDRFAEWIELHPDVLQLFAKYCRELRSAGHKRGSSKLVFERLRWEKMTSAHGSGSPALNNVFTSRLSRWMVEQDPSFEGWFETRTLKSRGKEGADV